MEKPKTKRLSRRSFMDTIKDPNGGIRAAIRGGNRPSLKKRGSLRMAFDGRYKFTRYFSPVAHNQPTTLEELLAWNDLELFDWAQDPSEINNLSADPDTNQELLLSMN